MKNGCPYTGILLERNISFPESLPEELKHIVTGVAQNTEIISSYTPIEQEYINYAILVQEFYSTYGGWLQKIYDNCYEPHMSREAYLLALYQIIGAKFQSLSSGSSHLNYTNLHNGIGTATLILQTLFRKIPHLSESTCIEYCESIMKNTHFETLPKNPKDKILEYSDFIDTFLRSGTPNVLGGKLFCPIKYTKEGNAFIRGLVSAIYHHFPLHSNNK